MPQTGRMAGDMINHREDEAHELRFRHRPHALCRHAHGQPGNHDLRQGSVDDPVFTEALGEPGGGPEHAAVDADVLAEDHHALVVRELPGQRHGHRLHQRHPGHQSSSSRAAARWAARSGGMSPYM